MDRKLLKLLLLVLITFFLSLITYHPALAAWNCEPIYGGGENCWGTGEILIDKTVKNASSGLFVDNLGVNDYKFAPGENVLFRLEIKNTGSDEFAKVTVKDVFPSYLDFVWGPSGWDSNSRTLQFDIYNLAAGESRQYEIMAKVFGKENLPSDRNIICVLNTGSVEADGKTDSDQAQVCFEKKVLGITLLPPTGPTFGWLVNFILIISSLFGLKLSLAKRKI